jgi:hypothetical protein
MAGRSKRQRSRAAVREAVEQAGGVEAAVAPEKRPTRSPVNCAAATCCRCSSCT